MKTFKEFMSEAELDQNTDKTKQIDNQKYVIKNTTHVQKFRVSIHPKLTTWLKDTLRGMKYTFTQTGNNLDIEIKDDITGKKFQEIIFTELNNAFTENNKDVVNFVGSTEVGDFIDTDFSVNVDLLR